jgi:hypothetical protein
VVAARPRELTYSEPGEPPAPQKETTMATIPATGNTDNTKPDFVEKSLELLGVSPEDANRLAATESKGSTSFGGTTLGKIYDALRITDDDHMSVCWKIAATETPMYCVIRTGTTAPAQANELVTDETNRRDVYFGVNPVGLEISAENPTQNSKRGSEKDVTRVVALYIDLDVKAGACKDIPQALEIIDELSELIGERPVGHILSGGGVQPLWALNSCDAETGRALIRRWGRLVKRVAAKRDVKVDGVFEISRILRVPGSVNYKYPRPVEWVPDTGRPVHHEHVTRRLDALDIVIMDDDTKVLREVVSAPSTWKYDRGDECAYMRKTVDGWASDTPSTRHPWIMSQLTRLACAQRSGCLSDRAVADARRVIERSYERGCATGDVRKPDSSRYDQFWDWALDCASRKSDSQVQRELGNHEHVQVNNVVQLKSIATESIDSAVITLDDAHTTFNKWLGDDYDTDALDAMLAAAAVEKFDDGSDLVWLLLVSGSGNAKTETVQALNGLGATLASAISSDAALLSGTSKRDRSKTATGGLLRKIGERGVLVIKDVTSILSMDRNLRAKVLAALREIYDGYWVRDIGTDGGQTIAWKGRIAVIGAVTTAWDTAHAVIATMGDRFVLLRMDSTVNRQAAGRKAIGNTGSERQMRDELAAAVAGVIAGMNTEPTELTKVDTETLLMAADLVTLARTAVERDYRGDVIDAHAPEMPTRFAKQLSQIVRGGLAIGMDHDDALRLAIRCARDSMPPLRLAIIEDLENNPHSTASDVRVRLHKPRATVDRELQALHMLGLAECDETDYGEKKRWYYSLAPDVRPEVLVR